MEHTGLVYTLIVAVLLAMAVLRTWLERKRKLSGYFRFMGGVEVCALALLLGALIFFGCLQIVLRNFFHSGIIWADPLMRHVVLWLGCVGGMLATKRIRHISIDVFTRLLPPSLKTVRDRVIHAVTAVAASLLGLATLKLVIDERMFGEDAFLGLQVWQLQIILPFAFFMITYRSLCNAMLPSEHPVLHWEGGVPGGGAPSDGVSGEAGGVPPAAASGQGDAALNES